MKIISMNVNGLRARLDFLIENMSDLDPDVLCLQETKISDEKILEYLPMLGFSHNIFTGRDDARHGVLISSKHPIELLSQQHARKLFVKINGICIMNLYVNQGQSIDKPEYQNKLIMLNSIKEEIEPLLTTEKIIICGDLNVVRPMDWSITPSLSYWLKTGKAAVQPEEVELLESIIGLGLKDVGSYYKLKPTWMDMRSLFCCLRIDYFLTNFAWTSYQMGDSMAKKGMSDHELIMLVL